MATKKTGIPPEVIAVVRAWARARDLEAGVRALAEGRRALEASLLPILISEVAEISVETAIDVIAKEDSADDDGTKIDPALGLPLYPKQVARIAAWQEDQKQVAEALGLDVERWGKEIERAVERVSSGAGAGSAKSASVDALKKVIGAERTTPTAPAERKQGLADVLKLRLK